ncbi:hypothetical protein [Rhodoblastus sp.]|uniref:hypothetical protein n=1 Tax=Rhodoblastus sp. TaxID=1962975 RepID=UPI003F9B4D87
MELRRLNGLGSALTFEIAIDMEIEDGVIWVYDNSEDGEMTFTDFGIENLIDLIKIHNDDPTILARRSR